ncbi:NYN domain-containing protein [Adlercreutzia sp. R7]|uniref:NYN domain-containing protein n=1 Tax=Adlercreutzia wanghongyangiae TaxID=3111451 RepID=A0ABU6IGP9_9ACTN|nr:NYN domain-containing protein [Adlercreutzia sp. R7]
MEPKPLSETSDKRFALLIDADNVSSRYIKPILNELSKYGTVTIKRIYGDWTLTLHSKWKDALLENSITPIQQFGYTQGKNATDSAMIIDAMDLLYTDNVDGFCLVSSDSDFTRLASRLRESGRTVIGMGEKKTPVPFRRACDVFTTLELLVQNKRERNGGGNEVPKDAVEQAVVDIITDNQNNGKSTGLGEIGSRLQKRYPDFDVRSYGTNLLSKLLEEFTRVRITKDHSSVTVELSDAPDDKGGERAAERPAERAAERTGERASEAAAEDEGASKPSRRSRSHRGTRRVAAKPAALTEGENAPVAALPQPTAEAAQEAAAEEAPEAQAVAAPAEKADVKPGRRARAERKAKQEKKDQEAPAEKRGPKADDSEEAAAEKVLDSKTEEAPSKSAKADKPTKTAKTAKTAKTDKTAKAKTTEKKASATGETPADQESSEPSQPKGSAKGKAAAKGRSSSKAKTAAVPKAAGKTTAKRSAKAAAPDTSTPAGYILHLVTEAGDEGIMLSTITDRLRAQFKDFKVRDLGYPQMRQYMAAAGPYALEQSGRNFRIRLAR